MKLLLLAGAGTSVELGVPGMTGLAEEFVRHCRDWDVEPELVERLIGDTLDIEHLIEGLDHVCSARESLGAIGEEVESLAQFDKIRAEVEWFVQHAAERLTASEAHLMWGPLLRAGLGSDVALVTTNYDRAIEQAANAEGIALDDGFSGFGDSERASWAGFVKDGSVRLIKLHGSTDWYASSAGGSPTKLRHPMPLFGRSTLRLPDGAELGSALVLPSREKLLTREPYPRLSQGFLNASDECDLGVIVGSSLRDPHLLGAANAMAERVPVFFVAPDGTPDAPRNATHIRQRASMFLISSLPRALASNDPIAALRDTARQVDAGPSVLGAVRQAIDDGLPAVVRCRALDDLDAAKVCLDVDSMKELVEGADATVARYALGLIPSSPLHQRLVELAAQSCHRDDPLYAQDLDMLRNLLEG